MLALRQAKLARTEGFGVDGVISDASAGASCAHQSMPPPPTFSTNVLRVCMHNSPLRTEVPNSSVAWNRFPGTSLVPPHFCTTIRLKRLVDIHIWERQVRGGKAT